MPPRKPIKQYITLKNGVIAFAVVCALILVFVGVGIREFKQKENSLKKLDKEFQRVETELKKKAIKDSLKVDSLERIISINSQKREKEIIKIVHEKEVRIKEINKPDFSNNDIRRGFSN